MNKGVQRITQFGLLTAMTLVLGLLDRAIPISAFLGSAIPGIRLGLANTVLLYAVYLMEWKSCVLLMLTKVVLSGFLFGSVSSMMYSFAGGALSLAVMLLVRRKPEIGALGAAIIAAAAGTVLMFLNPHPRGPRLWTVILIGIGSLTAMSLFLLIRKGRLSGVTGTSLAGAISHNLGQILMAAWMFHSRQLLITYLPFLAGIGAVVGCLTGYTTERVLKILKHTKYERKTGI